ncbi:hypothetical protein BO79DRAFT_221717 [Aspergillus costaricaensis CBS 115574]|uniref:Uncharacterized protein n=1 Tax=Aspergillus costaricaensis CBS 115574 TaxID=1448317 RepID=A0ACD1I247_9EURO|nr:hypothetical protein BO79DRAFT_221717 [Aspergillus costaricaensis CBS 115574]RAK84357.1 hypothetical protein BO79DRAFT_221717 [Aspergillus costaricaensis CBS 115574]
MDWIVYAGIATRLSRTMGFAQQNVSRLVMNRSFEGKGGSETEGNEVMNPDYCYTTGTEIEIACVSRLKPVGQGGPEWILLLTYGVVGIICWEHGTGWTRSSDVRRNLTSCKPSPGIARPLIAGSVLLWALRSRPKHEERWVLATIETLAGPTA